MSDETKDFHSACPLEAARMAIYRATTTEQPQKMPHR